MAWARKLSDADVRMIRAYVAAGFKQEWIGEVFGVKQHTVSRIAARKRRNTAKPFNARSRARREALDRARTSAP